MTTDTQKLFKDESSFKGKIGIFDIKNNEINHRLNFYKIEKIKLQKFFNFLKSFKSMINFML